MKLISYLTKMLIGIMILSACGNASPDKDPNNFNTLSDINDNFIGRSTEKKVSYTNYSSPKKAIMIVEKNAEFRSADILYNKSIRSFYKVSKFNKASQIKSRNVTYSKEYIEFMEMSDADSYIKDHKYYFHELFRLKNNLSLSSYNVFEGFGEHSNVVLSITSSLAPKAPIVLVNEMNPDFYNSCQAPNPRQLQEIRAKSSDYAKTLLKIADENNVSIINYSAGLDLLSFVEKCDGLNSWDEEDYTNFWNAINSFHRVIEKRSDILFVQASRNLDGQIFSEHQKEKFMKSDCTDFKNRIRVQTNLNEKNTDALEAFESCYDTVLPRVSGEGLFTSTNGLIYFDNGARTSYVTPILSAYLWKKFNQNWLDANFIKQGLNPVLELDEMFAKNSLVPRGLEIICSELDAESDNYIMMCKTSF